MERGTSGGRTRLEAEDKIAADLFQGNAGRVARVAAEVADSLARAAELNLDIPAGAAQACAVFMAARRWEVEAWNRFQDLTRGCRPALRGIWPELPAFPPADGETLADAESELRGIVLRLEEAASSTASVLIVPEEARPPQHARVKTGINARILEAELLALGDALPEVDAAAADVRQWILDVQETLGGLEAVTPGSPDPGIQFRDLIQGIGVADNPVVKDPTSLRHAYVLLGLDYIMEVHRKVPDYAEASGQSPRDPGINLTVSGGVNYFNQIATRITNIDSTIQGVAHQGESRIAEGLMALKQAVLDEPGLDDETRNDLLDNVEYLAESAQKKPEERKRGVAKKALAALTAAATAGAEISKAMTAWGDVLHKILSSGQERR